MLVARGLLNMQKAAERDTSERTVSPHGADVITKLWARLVADLARAAEPCPRRHRAETVATRTCTLGQYSPARRWPMVLGTHDG
jgi:hypothetical protein